MLVSITQLVLLLMLLLTANPCTCWHLRDNGRHGEGDKIPPPRSWTLALDRTEANLPPNEMASLLDKATLSFGSHKTLVLNKLLSIMSEFEGAMSAAGVDVTIEYVEGAGDLSVGQTVDARLYPREQPSSKEETLAREL